MQLLLLRQGRGSGQVVFHFLQSRQHRLAVGGGGLFVGGAGRFHRSRAGTAIEQRQRQLRPQRPEQVGGVEQVGQLRVPVPRRARQRERREERGLRHADLRIGSGHAALGSGNIGAALQQLRWQLGGHHRGLGQRARGGQAEAGGGLAQQRSQGVFQLGAGGFCLQQLHLGGLVLRFGLRHISHRGHARLLAVARQLPAALVGLQRFAQDLDVGLCRTQ